MFGSDTARFVAIDGSEDQRLLGDLAVFVLVCGDKDYEQMLVDYEDRVGKYAYASTNLSMAEHP